MEKKTQMMDIMELQKTIAKARELAKVKEEVSVVESKEEPEEVINTLPTSYINGNELKLSVKDVTHKVSYLDRLKQNNEQYETLKITEQKAKKIRRELTRLTTGSVSVVPLRCNGSECSFKSTCLSGNTLVTLKHRTAKIKDIKVGESIYSFNINTAKLELDTVIGFMRKGYKKTYKITTKYGNIIEATDDHLFLTTGFKDELKYMSIEQGLGINSELLTLDPPMIDNDAYSIGDMFIDVIINIEEGPTQEVYDITVKNNQNFIASNIVVHNCPLYQENIAPVGMTCLVEANLIEYWLEKYQKEFNVADDSITDMHMIARLCEYDVYDMRVTRYLAENDQTLLTDFVSSFAEDGTPITNKATSVAFDVKERIDRLRSKTLKELMATRESKAKVLTTVANATSTVNLAQMKQKFDDLVKNKINVIELKEDL